MLLGHLTCLREQMTSLAPSSPSLCAIPSPMPAVAAVINATFPSKRRHCGLSICAPTVAHQLYPLSAPLSSNLVQASTTFLAGLAS